jgi:hypothetical protein
MSKTWIQSRDCKVIELINPDLSEISIEEVAHSLARINRYTGHTRGPVPYSVAQHVVHVAEHLPPRLQFAGFRHDFHEFIVGDVSTPMKLALQELGGGDAFRKLDEMSEAAVDKRWPLDAPLDEWDTWAVRQADLQALVTERRDLLGGEAKPWGIDVEPWPEKIVAWTVSVAEGTFLNTFNRLYKGPR